MTRLRVGTRGSELARTQTREVTEVLERSGLEVETVLISTAGDRAPEARFKDLGPDIFTRALDEALLEGRIDCAVHSAKDMPTQVAEGIEVCAFVRRRFPEDVLVFFRGADSLRSIRSGGKVGTSSLRRKALLLHLRPDLEIVELRGNVRTRLERAAERGFDAAVLARAGLERLGLGERIGEVLDPAEFIPQAGQGALAVTCREDPSLSLKLAELLDDRRTRFALWAERAFLRRLGGGCQVPAGAYAELEGERLLLRAALLSPDGKTFLHVEKDVEAEAAREAGEAAAEELLRAGGDRIVGSLRRGGKE